MLRHRNMQLEATLLRERNSEKEAEVERRVKEAKDSLLFETAKVTNKCARHRNIELNSKFCSIFSWVSYIFDKNILI